MTTPAPGPAPATAAGILSLLLSTIAAKAAAPGTDAGVLQTRLTEIGRLARRASALSAVMHEPPELCAAGCGQPAAPRNMGRCDQPGTCMTIRNMRRNATST